MNEVVAIELQLDGGGSVKQVEKLEDALKEVNNTSSSLKIEEKFEKLNTTLDTTTTTFGEMSQAIEAYKTIALNAGRESPVGKEALARAAELKDKIADLDREVDNLANDGRNLQAALQIGASVTAGYQAFAGVTALVGDENEELMQTMVKLQAAQSVLTNIEQIRLNLEKESFLMIKAKAIQTKLLTAATWAYNLAVGGGAKVMKLFRLALISTGIGALVVLVGYLISKWDDWKDSIMAIIEFAFAPFIKVLQWLGVIESDLEKQRREAAEAYLNDLKKQQEAGLKGKYAHHAAMVEAMDESVGRVRKALKEKGIADNTVVIVLSDQGGAYTNAPLSGGKKGGNTLGEGGARVPFMIYYPKITSPNSVTNVPVQSIDLYPTLVEIASGRTHNNEDIQGVSLMPLLKGREIDKRNLYFFRSYEDQYAAVISGDWKLVKYHSGKFQLFNVTEDISEQNDLIGTGLAIENELKINIAAWEEEAVPQY